MKKKKEIIIQVMMHTLLKCYDSNGNLVEDYYYNVNLPELTENELKDLKELADGIF